VQIVERIGQREDEVSTGGGVLGVATLDCVACKSWVVAEILQAFVAIRAGTIGSAQPADSHARAFRKNGGASVDYLSHDLMAGNCLWLFGWEVSFDDVKVGPADATGSDFEEDLSGLGLRIRDCLDL